MGKTGKIRQALLIGVWGSALVLAMIALLIGYESSDATPQPWAFISCLPIGSRHRLVLPIQQSRWSVTDTFSGIHPGGVPAFVLAQLVWCSYSFGFLPMAIHDIA